MKLGVLLALALWGLSPGTAFACSVRQEALAEFTPQPPDPSLEIIRAQIVLQEVEIARSDPEARRGWYGIKATVLQADGELAAGEELTIDGFVKTTCFFPGAAYDRDAEGRLIGWVKLRPTADPHRFEWIVAPPPEEEGIDKAWANIRFPLADHEIFSLAPLAEPDATR